MMAQSRLASNLDKSEYTTPGEIVDYDDPPHLPVPEYPVRPDEPLETRKQRYELKIKISQTPTYDHALSCAAFCIKAGNAECWKTISC